MKIKCISILLIAFLLSSLTASAQSWLWGQQGNGALRGEVFSSNIATNSTGNVYETGGFSDSLTFGTTTFTSHSADAYLVKYDQNGNILWATQSKATGSNSALSYSVATDNSDNSYITGLEGDTIIFGADTLYSFVNGELFLVKYDPNGNVVWAKQPDTINIPSGIIGYAVATDKSGNEYVTGNDAVLIKFDRNGNIMWSFPQTFKNTSYSNIGYSVAPDIFGNIYLSGQFSDSLQFGTYHLYSAGEGIFIAKFDSNGNVLWAQQSTNNTVLYNKDGISVATDMSGSAFLTGTFLDTITFGSYTFISPFVGFTPISSFFVIKYNPVGNIEWGKEPTSIDSSSWVIYSICADDSNHLYISGSAGNSVFGSFVFANDTFNVPPPVNNDIDDNSSFLLKLDSSGSVICGSTMDGGGLEDNNSVVSDAIGKFVYWTGMFNESVNLGNTNLIDSISGANPLVGRWNSCYEMTGINQLSVSNDQLSIYPNPTTGEIFININSPATNVGDWNLKLIDVLGRTLYSMPSLNYTNTINLETLPAAMYFITVTNNSDRTVVPFVKVN